MNKNINFGAQGLKLTNIIITGRPNIDKSMRIYYDDESNITIPFNIAKRDKHSYLTLTERIALQLRNFEVSNHPDAINTVDLNLQNVDTDDADFYQTAKRVIYFALGTQDEPNQPSITKICWTGVNDRLKTHLSTILKEAIKNYDPKYTRLNHYEETHEEGQPISHDTRLQYYSIKVSLQDIA